MPDLTTASGLGDQLTGPFTHVHIGDETIPHMAFDVTSGSYGSVGHATIRTSRKLLDLVQIDLAAEAGSSTVVPVSIYMVDDQDAMVKIFDGDLLSTEWDMDRDEVIIHSRDHAGVFIDQKRVLARDGQALTAALSPLSPGQQLTPGGISTMNRRVSQIVSDIATEFGYAPIINMASGQTYPGTDILTGALYGSQDHTFMTIPQNLWSILNTLARDTGNEIYTTPDRTLVFGTPGTGLPQLSFTWNVPQSEQRDTLYDRYGDVQPGTIPCARLRISHNPRRNSTFRVLVFSYDPSKAISTVGRATYVAANLATPSLTEGLHVGADAVKADAQLLADAKTQGVSSDLSHVQLYTFHWDGLTNDDANSRAAAVATDIAKRLLHCRFITDQLPYIRPTQKFTISSPDLSDIFNGNLWYVSGFRHRFALPRAGARSSWEGLTTEVQALDLPNEALATGGRNA